MKVLIVVESHAKGTGGGPIYWTYLSEWLIRQGHEVTILSGITPGIPFASLNTIGVFPVRPNLRHRSLSTLFSRLIFGIRLIPAVRQFTQQWKPDIIHTVPPIASEAALRSGKTIGAPVIASVLSHVEMQWEALETDRVRSALFQRLEQYALHRPFSKMICLTPHSKRVLEAEGISPDRLAYIPHAVDTHKFDPQNTLHYRDQLQISTNSFVIGYAGTLSPDKGVDQLILALSQLPQRSHTYLLIAGEGPDRLYLENLAKEMKLENITFLGGLDHDDMPAFMRSLDLYVIPSYTETLPTSMLEAMASGIPVMATGVGGVTEFLQKPMGVLLPDSQASTLSEYLGEWSERRVELKRIGQVGRRYVLKEHTWEQTGKLTEGVYRTCLQRIAK